MSPLRSQEGCVCSRTCPDIEPGTTAVALGNWEWGSQERQGMRGLERIAQELNGMERHPAQVRVVVHKRTCHQLEPRRDHGGASREQRPSDGLRQFPCIAAKVLEKVLRRSERLRQQDHALVDNALRRADVWPLVARPVLELSACVRVLSRPTRGRTARMRG
jgi:hypothetical protein